MNRRGAAEMRTTDLEIRNKSDPKQVGGMACLRPKSVGMF